MTRTYRGDARTGYTMHCTGCADVYCTCKGALITPEKRTELARAVARVERQEAKREAQKQKAREGSGEAEWLQDNRAEKNRLAFHAACARLDLEVACNTAGHPIALSQEEASLILTAIVVRGLWTSADMTSEQRATFLARLNLHEGHKP